MFKFDWKPEDELKPQRVILHEGKGTFSIDKVHTHHTKTGEALTTKDGRAKITLQLTVTDNLGQRGVVYQDITQAMPWVVKALADALAMPGLYSQSGLDTQRILNREGECMIKTKKQPGFDDRSEISFLPCVDPHAPQQQSDIPDDLPF